MERKQAKYIFLAVALLIVIIAGIIFFEICSKSSYEGPTSTETLKKESFLKPSPFPDPATKHKVSQNNWCGSKMVNGECVFPSWDSCVKSLNCETDPAIVHPGWYNADKSKNYDDVAQAMINGQMNIVDACSAANTSWNSNPRCKIKEGEFSGKTGICVYDGVAFNKCQPVGQGCKTPLDNLCPGLYGDPFNGKIKNQNLMCRQVKQENGETKVTAVCVY